MCCCGKQPEQERLPGETTVQAYGSTKEIAPIRSNQANDHTASGSRLSERTYASIGSNVVPHTNAEKIVPSTIDRHLCTHYGRQSTDAVSLGTTRPNRRIITDANSFEKVRVTGFPAPTVTPNKKPIGYCERSTVSDAAVKVRPSNRTNEPGKASNKKLKPHVSHTPRSAVSPDKIEEVKKSFRGTNSKNIPKNSVCSGKKNPLTKRNDQQRSNVKAASSDRAFRCVSLNENNPMGQRQSKNENKQLLETIEPSLPLIFAMKRREKFSHYDLKVCPTYNSVEFTCLEYCHRLHVCLDWLRSKCNKGQNCALDHGFESQHNCRITEPFLNGQCDVSNLKFKVARSMKVRSKFKNLHEKKTLLLCHSDNCANPGCKKKHAAYDTNCLWQYKNDGWHSFERSENDLIEESFSNPGVETLMLPSDSNDNKYTINFEHLHRSDDVTNQVVPIRRIGTASDIYSDSPKCTKYNWFLEDFDSWKYLRQGQCLINGYHQVSLSDFLEFKLQSGTISVDTDIGVANLQAMTLFKPDGKKCRLRRRPAKLFYVRSVMARKLMDDCVYITWRLSDSSFYYDNIQGRMNIPSQIHIVSIDRVQNVGHWESYNKRKNELLKQFENHSATEEFLFHGTDISNFDSICRNNFNPELSGKNVGAKFGRGVYFTERASYADYYSKGKFGLLFLVRVLIGRVGQQCLNRDDIDTVLAITKQKAKVYLKWRQNEYYPEYAITYRKQP